MGYKVNRYELIELYLLTLLLDMKGELLNKLFINPNHLLSVKSNLHFLKCNLFLLDLHNYVEFLVLYDRSVVELRVFWCLN